MTRIRVRLNGEAVGRLLARKNMTQNDLARVLGVSSGGLSQFMKGVRCPSAAMRRRILARLKKEMGFDDLFIIEVERDGHCERV